MKDWPWWLKLTFFASLLVLGLFFFFYLPCLNHIDVNEIGLQYDSSNGDFSVQRNSGWYVTSPLVRVAPLSIKPMIVDIPSAALVNNKMIVRLRQEGAIELARMQGFHYGMNMQLEDIMRGYAFASVISGTEFPFLEVLQKPGAETMAPANK